MNSVFNKRLVIDFKVSKNDNFSIKEFSQLIFYSFGLYINNKSQDRELDVFKYKELSVFDSVEIKNFMIFNPLLGKEYHLLLPDLNFNKIEDFLKKNLK